MSVRMYLTRSLCDLLGRKASLSVRPHLINELMHIISYTLYICVTLTFDFLNLVVPLAWSPQYQIWNGYDFPFQSYDDYDFQLTASL